MPTANQLPTSASRKKRRSPAFLGAGLAAGFWAAAGLGGAGVGVTAVVGGAAGWGGGLPPGVGVMFVSGSAIGKNLALRCVGGPGERWPTGNVVSARDRLSTLFRG